MKQNQLPPKAPIKNSAPLKPFQFLSHHSKCSCSVCKAQEYPLVPQIRIDQQLNALKKNKQCFSCDFINFLRKLLASKRQLPDFPFLDTVIMEKGQPTHALFYEGKLKRDQSIHLRSFILSRKDWFDLNFQKSELIRNRKGFGFAQFHDQSQKIIKQFENNIRSISAMLNQVAIVKVINAPQQIVISKSQFIDLFDMIKSKVVDIEEVEYFQVFPIMQGREEHSFVKKIKYFRKDQSKKKNFKQAEANVITWKERNQSIEKLEQKLIKQLRGNLTKDSIKVKDDSSEEYLLYLTYKLFIYYEQIANTRVQEALVEYITNDNGHSFYFKQVSCLKLFQKLQVGEVEKQLPKIKRIEAQDRIELRGEMRKIFDGFQDQFQRLDRQRVQLELKERQDKQYSNLVYRTITKSSQQKDESLHKILASGSLKFKKQKLKL